MSESLKKIREVIAATVHREAVYLPALSPILVDAQEALRLFDEHVAAIAQHEAEPFGYLIYDDFHNTEDFTRVKPEAVNSEHEQVVAVYLSPQKPAALPQPVASVPQFENVKCPGHESYLASQIVPQKKSGSMYCPMCDSFECRCGGC